MDGMDYLRPLAEKAGILLQEHPRIVIAIDGMAASGKTTAADRLSRLWNAPVVHMDDFYLPSDLRTPERLAAPGGNVHYERFAEEVLPPLAAGTEFSYRLFDCSVMDLNGSASIPSSPVVLVEGAYAMHPFFGDYADLKVFFAVDPEEQKRRIIARNGMEKWKEFRDRWIPMENTYHSAFRIREQADLMIVSGCFSDT